MTLGPVVPTATAHARHRPVGDVEVTGGQWQHWQQVNRNASIPLGIRKLDEAGNLVNLRLAANASTTSGKYQGPVYMDSDVYKMLESVAWELTHDDDKAFRDFVATAADLLAKAQQDDGYLNSYYQVARPGERYTNLTGSHELYTAGHLMQAAVALQRATNDERLLHTTTKVADHLANVYLESGLERLDGHPGVETALVELYRTTHEARYLELARHLIDQRGKGLVGRSPTGPATFQDHVPVREMRTMVGHAVRAMYLEAGIVDVFLETGDESLLRTSEARWENLVATRTALTGGHGARQLKEAFGERYELPSDQSYNETCAAVASIHWSWRLLLATGDARYADLIERTLYNAFAASVSADGLEFFKGNPLQRRPDHADAIGDPRYRDGWFWSACCPPNVTRLMASLEHYVATTADDTVYLQQYAATSITVGQIGLDVDTDYPWDGTVRITLRSTPSQPWTLALRVPPWSATTRMTVAGEAHPTTPDAQGYVRLTRTWRHGDTVVLDLDNTPRLTWADPRIDALRGCVAVERGPLVYCFEQVDQPAGVEIDRLALRADEALHPIARDLPGIGRTVTIETDAVHATPPANSGLPYHRTRPQPDLQATRAVAVPYFRWANRDRRAMRVWLPERAHQS